MTVVGVMLPVGNESVVDVYGSEYLCASFSMAFLSRGIIPVFQKPLTPDCGSYFFHTLPSIEAKSFLVTDFLFSLV